MAVAEQEPSAALRSPARHHPVTPSSPAAPQETPADILRAFYGEADPVKRDALKVRYQSHPDFQKPEDQRPLTGSERSSERTTGSGGDQAGDQGNSPPYEPPVPMDETQTKVAQDFAADVYGLEVPGVSTEQKSLFLDAAITGALQDGVDLSDEAQCFQVGRTRHGAAWGGLVDDARKAVASLGPAVKDYLDQTGAGNSAGVVEALAHWQRGTFKLSAQEAKARLATEKDPIARRLLSMLAARS